MTYAHSSVVVPFRKGKLLLGKYQQVAAFEFDGRDGTGVILSDKEQCKFGFILLIKL